mgnify:CR=1 FL=1
MLRGPLNPRFFFIGILLFIFLFIPSIRADQKDNRFLIKHWGENSALPQTSVNSMVQTRDGYIWIATFGGLAKFDGLKFTILDVGNTPELKTNRFLKLQEDRKGNLWIFPEANLGVFRYSNNKITTFDSSQGLPSKKVNTVLLDSQNVLWFGTNKGVLRIESDQKTIYTIREKIELS